MVLIFLDLQSCFMLFTMHVLLWKCGANLSGNEKDIMQLHEKITLPNITSTSIQTSVEQHVYIFNVNFSLKKSYIPVRNFLKTVTSMRKRKITNVDRSAIIDLG